jgi:iron(III) transport system substrate-binding protein
VVVFNRDNVAEDELPDSLQDLTDPKWKGRIGWAPTNASFQTMVTAMRSTWGDETTRRYLADIQANEPKLYPKNTPIVAATATGEIDLGLVNHYYLHRFIQEDGEDFPARNLFLKDGGPGSLVMVSGAGVLEVSSNRQNAERFLRFMLSTVAQQYFAGTTFEYPLVEGVNTHRLLPPISELNGPTIDAADLADIAGTQSLLRDLGIIP